MEKISAFKTSDGQLFEDKYVSKQHQTEIDFEKWYTENYLSGEAYGSNVEYSYFKEWLLEHKDIILKFLKSTILPQKKVKDIGVITI